MEKQSFHKGLGLGTRFSLLVICILVITLGLNAYKLITSQKDFFKDQLEQHGAGASFFIKIPVSKADDHSTGKTNIVQ